MDDSELKGTSGSESGGMATYFFSVFNSIKTLEVIQMAKWELTGKSSLADLMENYEKLDPCIRARVKRLGDLIDHDSPDYGRIMEEMDGIEKSIEVADAERKKFLACKKFIGEKDWGVYKTALHCNQKWDDSGVFDLFARKKKEFFVVFSSGDYGSANKIFPDLISCAEEVIRVSTDYLERREEFSIRVNKTRERQAKVLECMDGDFDVGEVAEFYLTDLGKMFCQMRLLGMEVMSLVDVDVSSAEECCNHWVSIIENLEQARSEFPDFNNGSRIAKGKEAKEIILSMPCEDFLAKVATSVVPYDASNESKKFFEIKLMTFPSDGLADVALKESLFNVNFFHDKLTDLSAVALCEDPEVKSNLKKFEDACTDLHFRVGLLNGEAQARAEMMVMEVISYANAGLLEALSRSKKIEMLQTMRQSWAPIKAGENNNAGMTPHGIAMLELLGAMGIDEKFRKKDNARREKIVGSLLENPIKKEFLCHARDNWHDMDVHEKVAMCVHLISIQCEVLGIPPCLIDDHDKSRPDCAGYFNPKSESICISTLPQSSFHFSFKAVSVIMFHETTHWWQHLMVKQLLEGVDIDEDDLSQIQIFALNTDSEVNPNCYFENSLGKDAYKKQPLEKHAYEAGEELARLLFEELKK